MTAALAQQRFVHAIGRADDTASAEPAVTETAPGKGILGLNARIGAWIKAHPRLAALLVIAL